MSNKDSEYTRLVLKGCLKLCIFLVLLFLAAGRLDYWQGWGLVILLSVHVTVGFALFSDMKDLVKERMKPGPGTKWWDKIFWALFGAFSLATIFGAPLDAGRFRWTEEIPITVYIFAYLGYVVSIAIGMWAMRANRFFSSVVRIQKDRGQVVIDSGPYRFVRHPGYVGAFLTFLSLPLILGSYFALIPAVLSIVMLIIRTYLEDKTLHEELEGYADYAKRVRYRLIPGIW